MAFAFVEAAVVIYLRRILELEFVNQKPVVEVIYDFKFIAFLSSKSSILLNSQLKNVELFREAATIIMLGCLAYLVGNNTKQKIGAFLIAFSLWDIFYYVFLYTFLKWPASLFDIDVYFLIPLPSIGPIITPLGIFIILFVVGLKLFLKKGS